MINIKNPYFRKKLFSILAIVLMGYAFLFLFLFVKLLLLLYKKTGHLEMNASIAKELIIEFVMFALSGMFSYICFRIRKNIK